MTTVETTYAATRCIYDADSHLMELPGWLEEFADPGDRELLRPLSLGKAGALADQAIRRAEERKGDGAAAVALEAELLTAKGWAALGAFDSIERTRALDLLGFQRQFVFSTFAPTQFVGDDADLLWAGVRSHNRAMGAWCADDPRLIGVAHLPLTDAEQAVRALDEAIDFGCGAVHVPSAPPRTHAPTHPDLDPVWARIEDAGLPLLLHLGGQGRMIPSGFHKNGRPVSDFLGGGENVRAKDVVAMHVGPETFASAFILDGMFDRFPQLMLGIIEQGAEWVASWPRRLDRIAGTFARTEPTLGSLSLKPSEYIRRNVRVTPFPGEDVGWLIEQCGPEVFLFSSDYPHPEGGRDPIRKFEATMADVPDDAKDRFYWQNMADLLREPVTRPARHAAAPPAG
ncbi:MAG TPA: amidohydrolase family protein [Mycobacteriales bacterium]|nr:amidohydrolase family protein [Mycobacteriales bacterium]